MKKFATAAILALTLCANTAFAQAEQYDLGLFGDAAGTASTLAVTPFVPFNIYAVGFGLGDVGGYELSFNVPAGVSILAVALSGPAPLNIGTTSNWIVGAGGCLQAGADAFALGSAQMIALAALPADTAVCVGPATPSSFGGVAPGFVNCVDDLIPFGVAQNGGAYPDGCLIFNATQEGPVSTESTSFGDVKARF